MNNIRVVKEIFSRLFVIAIQNKMNLKSFTFSLEKSLFVKKIEEDIYDDYFNNSLEKIFSDITGYQIKKDESFGVYNDAYWCGYSYFELFLHTRKSFSYIFLKLPLNELIDLYPIYHEMDFTSLLEYFNEKEKKATILRLLCELNKISLPKLSNSIEINLSTLSKYNKNDEFLYKGSFENIIKISKYFNAPINLFINRL